MTYNADFLELAKSRYSVRAFDGTPLCENEVQKILAAGRLAPTARNQQPQMIYVLQGEEAKAKLRECTHCHFDAPAAFLVCYDARKSWKRKFDGKDSGDIDASIVATHMMLEAASIGVGSTWVMYFHPETTRKAFELPENIIPVCMLMMGHAAATAAPTEMHEQYRPDEETVIRM